MVEGGVDVVGASFFCAAVEGVRDTDGADDPGSEYELAGFSNSRTVNILIIRVRKQRHNRLL